MNLELVFEDGLVSDAAYDVYSSPFPQQAIDLVKNAIAEVLQQNNFPRKTRTALAA